MRPLLAGVCLFALVACVPPQGTVAKRPTLAPACAKGSKPDATPLVVEWPSTERGRLETLMHKGLVAIHYEGCEIRVLPECHVPGGYAWSATAPKHDDVRIKDSDQLFAALPFGAASLQGKLATAGELNVDMTLVGRYEATRGSCGRTS